MSIVDELVRLLKLDGGTDLLGVAQSARLHVVSNKVSISFRGTNHYRIANLNTHGVLTIATEAQQCPDLALLIIRLIKPALLNKTGYNFLDLEKMVNENEINNLFLSSLLLALRSS